MNISATQLRRAADIQDKIESLQNELGKLLGNGSASTADSAQPERKRRKMSAAARAKIAAAQRARWAKVRAGKK
jgi:ribosomal protein L15